MEGKIIKSERVISGILGILTVDEYLKVDRK
jgi:hypothetical protein